MCCLLVADVAGVVAADVCCWLFVGFVVCGCHRRYVLLVVWCLLCIVCCLLLLRCVVCCVLFECWCVVVCRVLIGVAVVGR